MRESQLKVMPAASVSPIQDVPDRKKQKGIQDNSDKISSKIRRLFYISIFTYYAPTEATKKIYEKTSPLIEDLLKRAKSVLSKDLGDFKKEFKSIELDLFATPKNKKDKKIQKN